MEIIKNQHENMHSLWKVPVQNKPTPQEESNQRESSQSGTLRPEKETGMINFINLCKVSQKEL